MKRILICAALIAAMFTAPAYAQDVKKDKKECCEKKAGCKKEAKAKQCDKKCDAATAATAQVGAEKKDCCKDGKKDCCKADANKQCCKDKAECCKSADKKACCKEGKKACCKADANCCK